MGLTNLQDLLDETIDFLDSEGYYVVLDKKYKNDSKRNRNCIVKKV